MKRYKNPNEVELTVRAAYTKGKAAGPDWDSIAGWIKATGTKITTRSVPFPGVQTTLKSKLLKKLKKKSHESGYIYVNNNKFY